MKVIAHRGFSAREPENTMDAFRAAWASGCDGVELDVRLTSDGHLAVFHDEDGMRLAGQPAHVASVAWEDLALWRIDGRAVPELKCVLDENPAGSWMLVELKSDAGILIPLFESLRSHPISQLAILAFDENLAGEAASFEYPVWLNVEPETIPEIAGRIPALVAKGIRGISCGYSPMISAQLVDAVHRAGLIFAAWTVNHPRDALSAREIGVDFLITDHPEMILKALGNAQ